MFNSFNVNGAVSTIFARVLRVRPSKQQLTELSKSVSTYKDVFDEWIKTDEGTDRKKQLLRELATTKGSLDTQIDAYTKAFQNADENAEDTIMFRKIAKMYHKVAQKKKSRSAQIEALMKEEIQNLEEQIIQLKNPVVNVENEVTSRIGILCLQTLTRVEVMPMDPLSVKELYDEILAKITSLRKIVRGGQVQDFQILDDFERVVDSFDLVIGESTGVKFKNRLLERVKGLNTPPRSNRSSATSTLFSTMSEMSQDSPPRTDNSNAENLNDSNGSIGFAEDKREAGLMFINEKLQEYVESLQLVVDDLFDPDSSKKEKREKQYEFLTRKITRLLSKAKPLLSPAFEIIDLESSQISDNGSLDGDGDRTSELVSQCFELYQAFIQLEEFYRHQKQAKFAESVLQINPNLQTAEIDSLFLKLEAGFNYDLEEDGSGMSTETGTPLGENVQMQDLIVAILQRMEVLTNELTMLAAFYPSVQLGEKDIITSTGEFIDKEMAALIENIFFAFEVTNYSNEVVKNKFNEITSKAKELTAKITNQ